MTAKPEDVSEDARPKCGIVMPISECDGCSEAHWLDVQALIKRAADKAGFEATLVSEADDVGVIQKRIVQNLYACPIVVCDISGRNSNVMFELGMRLAFDKATIIIKDDRTPFSFDTSPIEHLTYPRDLRYSKIELFQEQLAAKIEKSAQSNGESSFLKSFGSFKVADISVEKASLDEVLLDEFALMKNEMRSIRQILRPSYENEIMRSRGAERHGKQDIQVVLPYTLRYFIDKNISEKRVADVRETVSRIEKVRGVEGTELTFDAENTVLDVYFDKTIPRSILSQSKARVSDLAAGLLA